MKREIILTGDGSGSISIPEMNVTYHSIHGAIQESVHVFIEAGLKQLPGQPTDQPVTLFEMGFGTGLNALLTLIEADKLKRPIHYTAIELFPLSGDDIRQLNYCEQLNQSSYQTLFEKLHQCRWEEDIIVSPFFTFNKINKNIINYTTNQLFNLVYYDAFAPGAQPELWTKEIFENLYNMMEPGAILVTYCSKGDVRRAMQAAGFNVKKIPGPRGKREMIRARR